MMQRQSLVCLSEAEIFRFPSQLSYLLSFVQLKLATAMLMHCTLMDV